MPNAKEAVPEQKTYFKLFFDHADIVLSFSNEEAGKLLKSLYKMGRGEDPVPLRPRTATLFDVFRVQFARDTRLSKKRSDAGKQGGRGNKKEKSTALYSESTALHEKSTVNPSIENREQSIEYREQRTENGDVTLSGYFSTAGIRMMPNHWKRLREYMDGSDGLTEELVRYAVDACVAANAPNWNYMQGVLDKLVSSGIKTLDDALAADAARKTNRDTPDTGYFERPGSFDPKRGYE